MNDLTIAIPKHFIFLLNQVFEIEQKVLKIQEQNSVQRNIDRLRGFFETESLAESQGLVYHNPLGESFNETRTDCEATISGEGYENLKIIEVIRPIIYVKSGTARYIVQKGIVIVQSQK